MAPFPHRFFSHFANYFSFSRKHFSVGIKSIFDLKISEIDFSGGKMSTSFQFWLTNYTKIFPLWMKNAVSKAASFLGPPPACVSWK